MISREVSLEMGKANLEVFSETLQQLAKEDRDILAVTSDSRGSGKLVPFGERFPEQIVEIGIALNKTYHIEKIFRGSLGLP